MGRPKGSKNKVQHSVTIQCSVCHLPFSVRPCRESSAKFCSHHCKGIAWSRELASRPVKVKKCVCSICGVEFIGTWRGERYCSSECRKKKYTLQVEKEQVLICEKCGNPFTVAKKWGWYRTRFCGQACRIAARPFPQNRRGVRRAAIRRGIPMNKCSVCGYSEHPEILTLHHRDLNPKNNNQNNLIPVCPNCHSLAHLRPVIHPGGPKSKY